MPPGSMDKPAAIGVDFGTTNTVVARLGDGERAGAPSSELVRFATPTEPTATFRSTLSFNHDPSEPTGRAVCAGPWAIEAYLDDPGETRFIQSFKSYAASPLFTETQILGRRYAFEDMLSAFSCACGDKSRTGGDGRETRPVV